MSRIRGLVDPETLSLPCDSIDFGAVAAEVFALDMDGGAGQQSACLSSFGPARKFDASKLACLTMDENLRQGPILRAFLPRTVGKHAPDT
jgi:hypothetical protein